MNKKVAQHIVSSLYIVPFYILFSYIFMSDINIFLIN